MTQTHNNGSAGNDPFLYVVQRCKRCGHFVAKVAVTGFGAATRVAIVCVCKNTRCRADNTIYADISGTFVYDATVFEAYRPGILEEIRTGKPATPLP